MRNNNSRNNNNRRGRKPRIDDRSCYPLLKQLVYLNQQQVTRQDPIKPDATFTRQGVRDKTYSFWQTVAGPTISYSPTIETDGAIVFTLVALGNFSAFVALFDAYRIVQVKVSFQPVGTVSVGATVMVPPLYTVIDYDDANSTIVSALQEYDTLQVVPNGQFFERVLYPRIAVAAYSGTFTSYAQMKDQWLDCNSTAVQHYGLKYGLPTASESFTGWYTTISYLIQFKQTR